MESSQLSTPILFLVFNRPDVTQRVFNTIRQARPKRLYVAADGPRADKQGEVDKCKQTRKIATKIDWPCQVVTLFRDENLGCGSAVSQAISWFFDHETEGIILEDDCLPSSTFFTFCEAMLERYRNDKRIMEVGGNNFLDASSREKEYSYTFSNNNYIWGWATWKRVWDLYEYETPRYREISRKGYLKTLFHSLYEWHYFKWEFDRVFSPGRKSVWSYQLEFARRINSGLTVVPGKNLVINIGFGEGATHTNKKDRMGFKWELEEMEFPLIHPEFILPDKKRDIQFFNRVYTSRSSRIRSNIKRFIPERFLKKIVRPVWRTLSFSRLGMWVLLSALAS